MDLGLIMIFRENEMPTALIVEDEPEANKLLGMLLKLRGYRSTPAFTGAEALEYLKDNTPDVVFLDLMLPDFNGFDICRAIKASRTDCLTPVVIVTARVAAESRTESFRAGADDFVSKPYTPDQIFSALEQAEVLRGRTGRSVIEDAAPLTAVDDEALRKLAQLQNLILGRTPLAADAVERMGRAIEDVREAIDRWTADHPRCEPSTLRYELTPDRLILTIEGRLDWLDDGPSGEAATGTRAAAVLGAARDGFDEVVVDRDRPCLILIKKWAHVD
jgi:DNA-binding response OmpR family regulator